jgi:hypothetical protein
MKRILLFALCAALFSCTGRSREKERELAAPDSLVPRTLMVLILSDVHLAEAGIQLERNRGADMAKLPEKLYAGIFHKYRVTASQFDKSLNYYMQEPAEMEKLYAEVEQEIQRRSSGQQPAKPRPKDD